MVASGLEGYTLGMSWIPGAILYGVLAASLIYFVAHLARGFWLTIVRGKDPARESYLRRHPNRVDQDSAGVEAADIGE